MTHRGDVAYWLDIYERDREAFLLDRVAKDWQVLPTDVDNWSPENQARAIAVTTKERHDMLRACPGCRTDPDEWRGDDGRALVPAPYRVAWITCEGCRALARSEEEHTPKHGRRDPGGRSVLKPQDASDPDG